MSGAVLCTPSRWFHFCAFLYVYVLYYYIQELNKKDETVNMCARPPEVLVFCIHLHLYHSFHSLDPSLMPLAVNKEIIISCLFAKRVCLPVCVCALRPGAFHSNRLQITFKRCRRKVSKCFSASSELQLNLHPDGQKGRKVGSWLKGGQSEGTASNMIMFIYRFLFICDLKLIFCLVSLQASYSPYP